MKILIKGIGLVIRKKLVSNILILGGDGYLGWPSAMNFSSQGHKVTVVDNYFRRNISKKINVPPLYKIPSLVERANIWHKKTGNEIKVVICDLANPENMRKLFSGDFDYKWAINKTFNGMPDSVIHFAEQPSAPFSQRSYKDADFTLVNNLRVTNNLIWTVRDYSPDTHIIKLGTMGEYGTPNIDIEEGWIDINHKGRVDKFLFPRQASSIYHTTKIMDTDLLWFAVRTWGLRVTDLMQGPVYGIETEESKIDKKLRTLFNYDEIFGTVINRFIVQAVIGHPLTIYGSGSQIRGYLNIIDTLSCLNVAEKNPPKNGKLSIYNQIVELFSVEELAKMIQKVGNSRGYKVRIKKIENPRVEKENHYYNPKYQGLKEIGLKPNYLNEAFLNNFFKIIEENQNLIKRDIIFNGVNW